LESITDNLYDWGTHWFDMMNFYNDDCPVEWVIGQADPRRGRSIFGADIESQGMSYFRYANGVYGMMVTGKDAGWGEAENRLIGTEGIIEVGVSADMPLRIWGKGQREWSPIRVDGGIHGPELFACAIQHLVRCLETGEEPLISGRRALQAAELIFATYESSRIRGRVDLPLGIDDSPLLSLLESETEGAYGEL